MSDNYKHASWSIMVYAYFCLHMEGGIMLHVYDCQLSCMYYYPSHFIYKHESNFDACMMSNIHMHVSRSMMADGYIWRVIITTHTLSICKHILL